MSKEDKAPALPLGMRGAAQYLGLSEPSVRRLANNGQLPHSRDCENRRVFQPEDLQRYKRKRARR